MKKAFLLALIAFCSMTFTAHAQISGTKEYIRLPYKSEATFGFCYIRFSLPENWGIQVPFLKEYDAQLNIGTNIDYNLYIPEDSILQKPISFFFTLPEKTTPCMELRITGFANKEINSLESKMGNWNRIDNWHVEKTESYQLAKDSKILTFSILAKDEKEKELCRELIRSCKDYYDDYSDNSPRYNSIDYNANDTTYYPSFGLGFVMNCAATTGIYAKECNINEATTMMSVKLSFEDDDYDEYEKSEIQAPAFNLQYRFVQDADNADAILSSIIEYNGEPALYDYSIAGVVSQIYVVGSKFSPFVVVTIPTHYYTAIFAFSGVNFENASKVCKFLSQIYLEDSIKIGLPTAELPVQSFESLIGVQELGSKEILLNTKLPRKTKTITYKYADEGINVEIPLLDKKNTPNDEINEIATEVTEYNSDSYTTYSKDRRTACHVELYTNDNMRQFTNEICSVINSGMLTLQKEGYAMVNGRKWIILNLKYEDQKNFSLYYTKVDSKKTLLLLVESVDLKIVKTVEALLPKVSFKK